MKLRRIALTSALCLESSREAERDEPFPALVLALSGEASPELEDISR